MNRLIGAAISSNDAQRIRIHIILGRQELYCGVHVCRHQFQNLPGLGGEICKFAALALSEPPEVKRPGRDILVVLTRLPKLCDLSQQKIRHTQSRHLSVHRVCADIKRVRKPPHNGARIMPSKCELMGAANNAHVVVNSKICTV